MGRCRAESMNEPFELTVSLHRIPPSHTRTSRQIIPLAQGTFNNILQSMSEGAKAVRLVVSRPLQQLRNSIPRFLPGGGGTTTARPRQTRPQKQLLDLAEVHYHYDDFGNRIENPKEYLKQFKNSISHSHSHIGDASALPENMIKHLELKEELKFEKDVDSGNAFSTSYEFGKMAPFKSNFHNNHFNSFGGFDSSTTTHHNDDWTPLSKPKPASSLHTQVADSDHFFGSTSKFTNSRPVTNYRNVKHYDSDRPSTSYSFHHFASPNVDYSVDTKEKEGSSYGSPLGSSSMKVSKTQNFDHFYDYFDHKLRDHHGSESQIQAMAEQSVMKHEIVPESAPLVQKSTTTTTTTTSTTSRPITTARPRPITTRTSPRDHAKAAKEQKGNANAERPNYPEYFFAKPKAESPKLKFIPVRNVRDEEDLFKGSLSPPAKFMPQAPKFPNHSKEPLHIVMAQPVNDKASLKAKEKFRKQTEGGDKKQAAFSLRKRYQTTRLPAARPETTTMSIPSPMVNVAAAAPVSAFTEGYGQNEVVGAVESERKYPKKYFNVETTTSRPQPRPTVSHTRPVRARGSVKFGARL